MRDSEMPIEFEGFVDSSMMHMRPSLGLSRPRQVFVKGVPESPSWPSRAIISGLLFRGSSQQFRDRGEAKKRSLN